MKIKECPKCKKAYFEGENYCSIDASILEDFEVDNKVLVRGQLGDVIQNSKGLIDEEELVEVLNDLLKTYKMTLKLPQLITELRRELAWFYGVAQYEEVDKGNKMLDELAALVESK